jgi:CopG family nickel-responsive transcriptional regulator
MYPYKHYFHDSLLYKNFNVLKNFSKYYILEYAPNNKKRKLMSKLTRFGVSINKELLKKFDALIRKQKYPTRSKAIEDLIAESVDGSQISDDKTLSVGYIDMIYDHHKRQLLNKITEIQHDFHDIILSSQHVHIDHNTCLEIIVVKGSKSKIEKLGHMLKSTKGVKHGKSRIFSNN